MSDFYLNHSFEICVRIRFQSSSEWVEGSLKLSLCRFMCNIRSLSWIDLSDGSFAHHWDQTKKKREENKFSNFSCSFLNQKLFWPFTAWINCSSDIKKIANSRPSASNFKSFSQSLEQFLVTECFFNLFLEVSHI